MRPQRLQHCGLAPLVGVRLALPTTCTRHPGALCRAANLACLKGIGRSDDTLPVYLADLAAPRPQKVIGEADCLVHRTVLRGGKRTAAGEVQWYDWIPASEPELCPVTAEAAYLALRFEIQQQPVPDISTKDGLLDL